MSFRPGARLASRPLHFFFVTDGSGSMATDGKVQAMNNAIREAIPHLREVATQNPFANLLVRALRSRPARPGTSSSRPRWTSFRGPT